MVDVNRISSGAKDTPPIVVYVLFISTTNRVIDPIIATGISINNNSSNVFFICRL